MISAAPDRFGAEPPLKVAVDPDRLKRPAWYDGAWPPERSLLLARILQRTRESGSQAQCRLAHRNEPHQVSFAYLSYSAIGRLPTRRCELAEV